MVILKRRGAGYRTRENPLGGFTRFPGVPLQKPLEHPLQNGANTRFSKKRGAKYEKNRISKRFSAQIYSFCLTYTQYLVDKF